MFREDSGAGRPPGDTDFQTEGATGRRMSLLDVESLELEKELLEFARSGQAGSRHPGTNASTTSLPEEAKQLTGTGKDPRVSGGIEQQPPPARLPGRGVPVAGSGEVQAGGRGRKKRRVIGRKKKGHQA